MRNNALQRYFAMIYSGTCSWTEKTLLKSGEFYPPEVKTAEARIQYYAERFSTVEVDSSYYAIPDRNISYFWAERTPSDFIFHVKAYGALTGHGVDPRTLPVDIMKHLPAGETKNIVTYIKDHEVLRMIAERFTEALSPLIGAGKLGVTVFQFPPWFRYSPENLDYILGCRDLMKGLSVAVEFRHGSWLTPENAPSTLNFLRSNNLTYIAADEPQFGSLATIPFMPEVTTDTAYFRFHGRNTENWLKKGVETSLRYDYLYSEDELKGFAGVLSTTGRTAKKVYAMFNNCHGASAIKNALRLKDILKLI